MMIFGWLISATSSVMESNISILFFKGNLSNVPVPNRETYFFW